MSLVALSAIGCLVRRVASYVISCSSICNTCIYADREYLPPAVINSMTTGNLQTSWLEDFNPKKHEVYFASSEKGWTNDKLGFKWLELFDQHTRVKAHNG